MSKVKFIQWGTPEKPKTYQEYTESFEDVKSQYPGGVIFVTYTDDNDKQKQEIWANGVQYSVGGGGGNVIYGDTKVNADGTAGEVTGEEGYIYVYTGENTQTAYYWKDNKWNPFNVNAENIWFPNGVQRTEPWGAASIANANPKSECIGSNLKQLLENYLVKETWPSSVKTNNQNSTTPTWSVETGGVTLTVTKDGQAFASGYPLLYGSTLQVTGSYTPQLSLIASGFTTESDGSKSKCFNLGPSQITGLTNGYQFMQNGSLIGDLKTGNTASGETLYYKVVIDSNQTDGGDKYPTFTLTQNMGGSASWQMYTTTGANHTSTLNPNQTFDCEFKDQNNIKDMLGNRTITATGTNSNTWQCAFHKGVNNGGTISYTDTATTDNSISVPGLTVAIASNKYNVDTSHTKTHSGFTVSLEKVKSDSTDTATCTAVVYLPIYEYNSGNRTELTDAKYKGSSLVVKNGTNLPLAMPKNCNQWWIEVPQCATLTSFEVTTPAGTFPLHGSNTIEEVVISEKEFNNCAVPYKKIKFTDGAAYTTDATLKIQIK